MGCHPAVRKIYVPYLFSLVFKLKEHARGDFFAITRDASSICRRHHADVTVAISVATGHWSVGTD